MKKELIRDITLTLIIFTTDLIYMPFPLFIQYFYSYLKMNDLTITFGYVFLITFAGKIGSILSNIIMPKLFFIFGIRKTFFLGGALMFIYSIISLFTGRYLLFLLGILGGFINNLKTMPTNYLFSIKYTDGEKYLAYSYMGQSFGVIIWGFFIFYFVNPENDSMDQITDVNGFDEYYYPKRINDRFPLFILANGIISFFVISICSYFFKVPSNKDGNFFLWYDAFFNKTVKAMKLIKKKRKEFKTEFKSLNISSINQISFMSKKTCQKNSKISETLVSSCVVSTLTKDSLQKDIEKTLYSKKFIGFIIITFIKNTSADVIVNCVSIIGQSVVKSTNIISLIFIISCLMDIIGRFLVSYTWTTYGFYKCTYFHFLVNIFTKGLFLVWGLYSEIGFIFVIIVLSQSWAYGYLLGHTSIFGLFRPDKAIGLCKAFEIYYLLLKTYSCFIVQIFITKGLFSQCFIFLSIIEIIACYYFYKYYKNFGE